MKFRCRFKWKHAAEKNMALKNKDRQKCLESLGLDESATEGKMHALKIYEKIYYHLLFFYDLLPELVIDQSFNAELSLWVSRIKGFCSC